MKKLLLLSALLIFACSSDDTPLKVSTIGDSRFSWSYGDDLRMHMNSKGDFEFIGSLIDNNGFHHDSKGGDNSQGLLDRLHLIPTTADVYVIMFGTNDSWRPSTQIPFVTLKHVINTLLKYGDILYLKQSPRADAREAFCIELDSMIVNEFKVIKGFDYMDVRSKFMVDDSLNTDLLIDHVHPSENGIKTIAEIVAKKLLHKL